MTKKEMRERIKQGFSDVTPDIFENIMEKIEKVEIESDWLAYKESSEEYKRQKISWTSIRYIAVASIVCFMIGLISFSTNKSNVTPSVEYSVVMRINPEVYMRFDQNNILLEFKGLNKDGKELEERVNIEKGSALSEIIVKIVEDGVKNSYLSNTSKICFTFEKEDESSYIQWRNTFADTVEEVLKKNSNVNVKVFYSESEKEDEKIQEETKKETDKSLEKEKEEKKEKKTEEKKEKKIKKTEEKEEKKEKKTEEKEEKKIKKTEEKEEKKAKKTEKKEEKKAKKAEKKEEKKEKKIKNN